MQWKKPFAREFRPSLRHRFGLLLLVPCAVAAQKLPPVDLPRDMLDLVQIRQKISQNLTRLPDFTCVETMLRSRRANRTANPTLVDSMRLEVLYTGEHELHAWPGSRKFETDDPVSSGLSSNGEFAMHVKSVFLNNVADIRFVGKEDLLGRPAIKYTFRISSMVSGWRLTFGSVTATIGEQGTFWADPQTYELLRLDINGDDFPPNMAVEGVMTRMDFGRVRIGKDYVLAPQAAELLITEASGAQSRNQMEFTQCRQFHAESAISFDAPAAAGSDPEAVTEIELPAGLTLKLDLDSPVDSDTSMTGDPVTAIVSAPVEVKGQVVFPKGALAHGRIRRMERYEGPHPYLLVGLEFTEIEFENRRAAFFGRLANMDEISGVTRSLSSTIQTQSSMMNGRMELTRTTTATVGVPEIPGVGTFFAEGRRARLPKGWHMTWQTVGLQLPPSPKR